MDLGAEAVAIDYALRYLSRYDPPSTEAVEVHRAIASAYLHLERLDLSAEHLKSALLELRTLPVGVERAYRRIEILKALANLEVFAWKPANGTPWIEQALATFREELAPLVSQTSELFGDLRGLEILLLSSLAKCHLLEFCAGCMRSGTSAEDPEDIRRARDLLDEYLGHERELISRYPDDRTKMVYEGASLEYATLMALGERDEATDALLRRRSQLGNSNLDRVLRSALDTMLIVHLAGEGRFPEVEALFESQIEFIANYLDDHRRYWEQPDLLTGHLVTGAVYFSELLKAGDADARDQAHRYARMAVRNQVVELIFQTSDEVRLDRISDATSLTLLLRRVVDSAIAHPEGSPASDSARTAFVTVELAKALALNHHYMTRAPLETLSKGLGATTFLENVQLVELMGRSLPSEVEEEVRKARIIRNDAFAELQKQHPGAVLFEEQVPDGGVFGADTLYVSFHVADERLHWWALDGEGMLRAGSRAVGEPQRLERLISEHASRTALGIEPARELYDLLFRDPLEGSPGTKKLYWSPWKELQGLNPAALVTGERDGEPIRLVQTRMQVARVASLQHLLVSLQRAREASPADDDQAGTSVLLGACSGELQRSAPEASFDAKLGNAVNRILDALKCGKDPAFKPRVLWSGQPRAEWDEPFDQITLRSALREADYAVILAHAGWDEQEGQSWFVAANSTGREAVKITQDDLVGVAAGDCRVLVLGACSSKPLPSQSADPVGIIRPFLLAGLPTVLFTNNSVTPGECGEFLDIFFRGLRKGHTPGQAFVDTQEALFRPSELHPWMSWEIYGALE